MYTYDELPIWHRDILTLILQRDFPGRDQILIQIENAIFKIIDQNGTLDISTLVTVKAEVVTTVPIQASSTDVDDVPIEVLLFTRGGIVYMLEVLRVDGERVKSMPSPKTFTIEVLSARKRHH